MSNLHINTLHVKHFKCFDSFELKDIQRINLIGGKNNVGKTSLLEAIELFAVSISIRELVYQVSKMLYRRQVGRDRGNVIEIDFLHGVGKPAEFIANSKKCAISLLERGSKYKQKSLFDEGPRNFLKDVDNEEISISDLLFSVDGEEEIIPANYFFSRRRPAAYSMTLKNNNNNYQPINFIESTKMDDNDLAILYGSLIDLNREEFINESLSIFDENILSIKQRATDRGVVLKLQLKNKTSPVLLSSLGEGVNRNIAILCAIWASKDGILLIDEIENGIHYSNYKKLWHLIYRASDEANCQLFITSHSKECVEAFNKSLTDMNDSYPNGMYYEMYRNLKKDVISVSARDYEQLNYTLTHGGKFRGE
jgi:AAA15 family ATPase/GTPase